MSQTHLMHASKAELPEPVSSCLQAYHAQGCDAILRQVWRLYGGVWAFMDVLHRALEGLAWLSPGHRPSTPRHAAPQHEALAPAPPSGGLS